jgi:hypothetical protein
MSTVDRMFRVIVAGGVALTAALPGVVVGCGGSIGNVSGDAGGDHDRAADAFPQEGPAQFDAFPQETGQQIDAFPQEGFVEPDAFPQEGPAQLDAGLDADTGDAGADAAADADAGFPFETAQP